MTGPWKTCADCDERKSWSEFWPKTKWPDGSMRQPHAYCKDCWRERSRAWKARRRRERPDLVQASDRAVYARVKRDPRRLARRREINRDTQRRKKNIPPERWRILPVDAERQDRLPIGPFREWLNCEIEARGSMALVGDLAGIAERTIYRWLNEADNVEIDSADRVLCACDQPEVLRELYPELYGEAVA